MNRLFLFAALLLPASSAVAQRADDYESRVDSTFAFDRRGTIVLSVGAGDIIVTAWDRPQVRVRATSERSQVRLDASATRLSVDLVRSRGGDTRFELTVPIGARVAARSSSGDISIRGTKGIVEVNTQNGDVLVEDAAEIVDLRSYGGDLVGRNLSGNIEVNTLNGDLELFGATGEVEVSTVSGDIDLRDIAARYIRAKTTSGDVTFEGTVDSTGRYELASHSGSVSLVLPRNTGALLTLATYTGGIESDFPITLKPGEHGLGSTKRFTFQVGTGDARINAESFSGDITIRSRGAPTDR